MWYLNESVVYIINRLYHAIEMIKLRGTHRNWCIHSASVINEWCARIPVFFAIKFCFLKFYDDDSQIFANQRILIQMN